MHGGVVVRFDEVNMADDGTGRFRERRAIYGGFCGTNDGAEMEKVGESWNVDVSGSNTRIHVAPHGADERTCRHKRDPVL